MSLAPFQCGKILQQNRADRALTTAIMKKDERLAGARNAGPMHASVTGKEVAHGIPHTRRS